MSARSFGSLFMVASCAGAALGCYLVSLRVASERAALEDVETQIVSTQGDLRLLQTEIGTRGRLSQLERWNAGVFQLSAPAATQFVQNRFEHARLEQPEHQPDFHAPVVLASAPAPAPRKPQFEQSSGDAGAPTAAPPAAMLHEASLKTETREVPAQAVVVVPQRPASKSANKPVTAAKPALPKSVDKPGLAAANQPARKKSAVQAAVAAKPARKKSVDKPALASAKPVTKHIEVAKVDPLAPLPAKHSGHSKDAPTGR